MKNILNIFIPIVLSSLLFVGCEDHLKVDTYNDITGGSFWQSPGDAQTYVIGIQADVAATYLSQSGYMSYVDGRTDMLRPGGLGPRFTNPPELHTQTATLGGGNWRGWYETVHHCNLFLQEIEAITFEDAAKKTELIAIVHFLRAFTYFDLVRIFGDVPLVKEPTTGKPGLDAYYSRSPKAEVLDFVKTDIEAAIAGLPNGIADKNFVSKIAAYALKAEVYMWTGKAYTARGSAVTADLNTAIAAIDAIETSNTVSFNTGPWASTFTREANDSPEYIWAHYYDYIVGPVRNAHWLITIRIDNVPDTMQNTFPIAYTDEGLNRVEIGNTMNNVFKELQTVNPHVDPYNQYDQVTMDDYRDLRYNATMLDIYGDGSLNTCFKFPGIGVDADNRRYWDNDMPLYRWTDMLLLKAEALNTIGGQTAAVVATLDMTRARGDIAPYAGATDQATLEDEIIKERMRELCAENKHYWDLIRAHKVAQYVPRFMTNRGDDSTNPAVWDFYYWPVAESVLIQNGNLTQSPGYTVK
ncbi:MAG TPA: RagB/SusD family nutrient uptake outer membrane protein [Bacteroides sp.]|nr:RagB/SusD family nutrient uptake outer membrane protein [Bacteroides sp.]